MSVPEVDQQQLIRRIGRALLGAAPPNWKQIRAEYRSAGRHIEVDVVVTANDDQTFPIRPPMDVVELFGELRTAMYRPGRGTWLSGVYLLDHPSKFSAEFEPDTEPRWRRMPPPIGFQDELRQFPREDGHIPEWLRARAGLPPVADQSASASHTGGAPGGPAPAGASPATPGPAAHAPGAAGPAPAGAPQFTPPHGPMGAPMQPPGSAPLGGGPTGPAGPQGTPPGFAGGPPPGGPSGFDPATPPGGTPLPPSGPAGFGPGTPSGETPLPPPPGSPGFSTGTPSGYGGPQGFGPTGPAGGPPPGTAFGGVQALSSQAEPGGLVSSMPPEGTMPPPAPPHQQ